MAVCTRLLARAKGHGHPPLTNAALPPRGRYPNNPGTSPTDPGGLGKDYCVVAPGTPHVLCFAFRTDNSGPPESVDEVIAQWNILRWQFPGKLCVCFTV